MVAGASAEALLGLTDYEARVYRVLLAEGPATAYRLGVRSGVPLSRVYGVTARLVKKGAAVALSTEPRRFRAVSPARLVAQARARANEALDQIERELSAVGVGASVRPPEWLDGEEAALAAALALLGKGGDRVVWAAGARAAQALRDRARQAGTPCGPAGQLPSGADEEWGFAIALEGEGLLLGRLGTDGGAAWLQGALPAALGTVALAPRRRERAMSRPRVAPNALDPDWLKFEERKQSRLLRAH